MISFKKYQLLSALSIVSLVWSCNSAFTSEDLKLNEVQGNVKELIEYTKGSDRSNNYSKDSSVFDSKGRLIFTNICEDCGYLKGAIHRNFDDKGNLVSELWEDDSKWLYFYDDMNNLIDWEARFIDSDLGSNLSNSIKKTEFKRIDYEGNLTCYTTYNFLNENVKWRKTNEIWTKASGYDDINDYFSSSHSYSYDSLGRLLRSNEYDENGNFVAGTSYLYNDLGNLSSKIYYNDEAVVESKIIYKYNSNGLVVKTKHVDNKSNLRSEDKYEYEFDSKGNWITKFAGNDTFYRKIVYY